MTLAFKTKFPRTKPDFGNKPTYFIEKIWAGLIAEPTIPLNIVHYEHHLKLFQEEFGCDFGYNEAMINPKIHTIRKDENNRWKRGNDIHLTINVRTPFQWKFAPTIKCDGVEFIKIRWMSRRNEWFESSKAIEINGKYVNVFVGETKGFIVGMKCLGQSEILSLAKNDGFETIQDFFKWFDENFDGKIIHWTKQRYDPRSIKVESIEVKPQTTAP